MKARDEKYFYTNKASWSGILLTLSLVLCAPSYALTVVQTPIGPQTETHFIAFCAYCSTQSNFQQAAVDYWKANGLRGDWVTEVINQTTGQAYFVEVIYQPADSPYYAVGDTSIGQSGDLLIANAINHLWTKGVAIVITPGDANGINQSGVFDSFNSFSRIQGCSEIYDAFTSDPATNPATTWWGFIEAFFEGSPDMVEHANANLGLPVATVVFLNGDVAQFQLISPDTSDVCNYKKGSARNNKGQFINDAFLGGNGLSNGSQYVLGTGPGSDNIYLYEGAGLACVSVAGAGSENCTWYTTLVPSEP